jgi:hypothetical protein
MGLTQLRTPCDDEDDDDWNSLRNKHPAYYVSTTYKLQYFSFAPLWCCNRLASDSFDSGC